MRIRELFGGEGKVVSFEFFPPKSGEGDEALFAAVAALKRLAPSFVSVTYGAGGGTRRRTLEIVTRIKRETGIEAMAHLTCVGHTKDEIREIADRLAAAGVENLLALRGDPPRGATCFEPVAGGFRYASELIAFLKGEGYPFCIGAACYPEGHPEAGGRDADLRNLKIKVEAGAEFLITQLFFDNADYFVFVKEARRVGIELPILPGIMPITNYRQIRRFTQMCGATIPGPLAAELEMVKDDLEAVAGVGISHAIDQCRELLARGAPGLHFYTLNRSSATRAILARLRRDRGI